MSVAGGGEDAVDQDRHLGGGEGGREGVGRGNDRKWRDFESYRKNRPNYFMLHFSILVELALMPDLEGNYKKRLEGVH